MYGTNREMSVSSGRHGARLNSESEAGTSRKVVQPAGDFLAQKAGVTLVIFAENPPLIYSKTPY